MPVVEPDASAYLGGVDLSGLSLRCARVVSHSGREVPHKAEFLPWEKKRATQLDEVQPSGGSETGRLQPVVQVVAIDVDRLRARWHARSRVRDRSRLRSYTIMAPR